jgi:hypothetical protein
MEPDGTNDDVIQEMDALHARISSSQRSMFELITEADRQEAWQEFGARDMAHFLSMRYGISCWKASRWIHPAHALEGLPRLSEALGSGQLGIDTVVELARFATAETESDLVAWARGVSVGCVRRKADVTVRQAIEDVRNAQASRFLSWWYFDDGRRFGLEAELPAAEGAAVARALEHLADELPGDAGGRGRVPRGCSKGRCTRGAGLHLPGRRPRAGPGFGRRPRSARGTRLWGSGL